MTSLLRAAPWKVLRSSKDSGQVKASRLLYKSEGLVDTQIKETFLSLFTADEESSCINIIISFKQSICRTQQQTVQFEWKT